MRELIDGYKRSGNLHHAYGISGARDIVLPELLSFFEKELGIKIRGNPDVLVFEYETFGIDEGRMIKELHVTTPLVDKKLFVLIMSFITHEAQNSLLKIFEEPNPHTHFFLILPSTDILLPTLRSRLFLLEAKRGVSEYEAQAKKFLKGTVEERLSILSSIIEEKNKNEAIEFLNALETHLHTSSDITTPDIRFALEEIMHARGYLKDRSPSVKMLLEHIAVVIEHKTQNTERGT